MSRSKRKHPWMWTSRATTQHWWKKKSNRRHRRHITLQLASGQSEFEHLKKFYNVWNSPSDGKWPVDFKAPWGNK